jgi:hypothetical protein
MSVYIDANSRLHHDQQRSLALTCPHCQVFSHITPVSVPSYAELLATKPGQVGVVYRCDSCNSPVFLKFAVKAYGTNCVELSTTYVELERVREKFQFTHLPEDSDELFREALGCYSSGHFNAFASMCRRTMQAILNDCGESGRPRVVERLGEAREMAEIDDQTFDVIKHVLFGSDADGWPTFPSVGPHEAGVLLELMKDLLYQTYVRRGKLQQAMLVRRYFAEETLDRITPIERAAGEG